MVSITHVSKITDTHITTIILFNFFGITNRYFFRKNRLPFKEDISKSEL